MYKVTKEFKFDSAHYLKGYSGKCANLHGHTWRLAVTIQGRFLNNLGMLMDFKRLKEIVENIVIDYLDHKVLNDILEFNPTAENISKYIFKLLEEAMWEESKGNVHVVNIRLWENYPESYVDYFRD